MTRKTYAGNTSIDVAEVLWRHTYFGHGLSVRQILDELARMHPGTDALPTEKTVRNQLANLHANGFLGRRVDRVGAEELSDIECADPQPGWYMDAFLTAPQMRLLADSLTLSRIDPEALNELVGKIRELAGAAGDGIAHLEHVASYAHMNGEFLYTIDQLNQAIEERCAVTFAYRDYAPDGSLVPHVSRSASEEGSDPTPTVYTADPYQMVYKNGRYYLICRLHDRPNLRTFVVDRIAEVDLHGGRIAMKHPMPEDFDAVDFMRHRPYPVTDDSVMIHMVVRGQSMLNNVFEWFDEPTVTERHSATSNESPEGREYIVTVEAPERAVFWWALQYSWNGAVIVASPDSLKQQLYQAGTTLIKAYRRDSDATSQ
ncbi:helix-turn-helix transcriptional regulator [Bifidobacterium eulemuris]|uniref:WYL domain-containing protein n=1 Tax=Bifidobacterium eulemuris TaxID=1765219 RepID=A0A261GB67_9BIFI|nr:WYL domain-containing protein [Bifidobacterium eulemuris]OZG68672.1 WYL domain-containing protein [Bifidobacterium eulemuris]QOL32786.1 WYL domain-containing protein [Bifidobacterium eulemuris]